MSGLSRRSFLAGSAGLLAACARSAGNTKMQEGRIASRFEADRFVDDVKRARMAGDSEGAVQEVLARAVSEPGVVVQGIGEPSRPGIHTMYHAKDLTILNVVWAPLMVLLPHDHRMWAVIGIYTGREDNMIWERKGQVIEASGAASLSEREVFPLPSDAIHSVVNPIRRLTGAIHIYGGDFFDTPRSEWDAATLQERPFDLAAARELFQEASRRFEAGR
jgi:predicted metal-dependent enzyme (double-stranded beta helix superfamily)